MKTFGAIPDRRDDRDYLYKRIAKQVKIPDLVDYEARMSPVKNQGPKGACVSFAVCAVKEYQEMRERGFREVIDLSEDFIYAQTQVFPGGGSYPRDAMKILTEKGVSPERFYPYERKSDKTKTELKLTLRAMVSARRYRADGYVRLVDLDDVLQSCATNGPLTIGVEWLTGWDGKKSLDKYPVLDAKKGMVDGYHEWVIVGYDATREILKCRNSWGREWGNRGYAYLTFDAFSRHAVDCWATYDRKSPLIIATDN